MPLDHIGRYQIEAELGKGAMGVVYRAVDPNIGRTVALKTMRVDVHGMESEEMLKRFQAEARNAGVLSHANIVTIYDAQELEGTFYIAMEFIQGQTLHDILKHGTLPVDKVIEIARQVCAGLDYAHARGIVHRDIKPANIMIEPDGTVKIMDFGIAKGAGTGMTSTGQVLGTPNYMSPEQVKGKQLDGRSDLFSLGVVLYEMLTGARPFTGDNVTTVIYKIVNEHPAAPSELDVTVNPGMSAVVMKALNKNREDRHQSGAELIREFESQRTAAPLAATRTLDSGEQLAALQTPIGAATQAAAATAAKAVPMMQSTVRLPQPAPSVPPATHAPPKPRSPIAIVAVVFVAMVALAGYLGIRHKRARTPQPQPQPVQTVAAPPVSLAPLAATVPENKSAEATPAKKPALAPRRVETRRVVPPPKPVPAPQQGFISVKSTPAAAAIILDGQPTGVFTPATLSIKPGQHTITVNKTGYRSQAMSAAIGAGETLPMEFKLPEQNGPAKTAVNSPTARPSFQNVPPSNAAPSQPQDQQAAEGGNPFRRLRRLFGGREDRGMIVLRTLPMGAEIFVNGRPTGRRTPIRFPAPVGKYRVALRMPGYRPSIHEVQIEKGKTVTIEDVLQKQP